jgi:hypothetical protein
MIFVSKITGKKNCTLDFFYCGGRRVQNAAVGHIHNPTLVKVSDLTQIFKNNLQLVTVNLEMLSSS